MKINAGPVPVIFLVSFRANPSQFIYIVQIISEMSPLLLSSDAYRTWSPTGRLQWVLTASAPLHIRTYL